MLGKQAVQAKKQRQATSGLQVDETVQRLKSCFPFSICAVLRAWIVVITYLGRNPVMTAGTARRNRAAG